MINRTIKMLLAAMLCVCGLASVANAQQTITPEKKALIKELLEATGGHKTSEEMMNAMLQEMDKELPQLMSTLIDNDRVLTPAEKVDLKKDATEIALRASRRFRELFMQRVNVGQLIEDVSYPLYDKYFSADEIRDLITFYKSATGKKAIEVMPALMAESVAKTNEVLLPAIQQLIKEITDDELSQHLKEKRSKPRSKS